MVQKRETKAINKLCVREILSLSFVCGAYFLEFRGRNPVCFVIAYNFNGKFEPEAGKTRMRTAFFTHAPLSTLNFNFFNKNCSNRPFPTVCHITSFSLEHTDDNVILN